MLAFLFQTIGTGSHTSIVPSLDTSLDYLQLLFRARYARFRCNIFSYIILVHAIYIFFFIFLLLSRFLKQLSQHCYTWCHSPYFPYSGWLIWRETWRQCGMSLLLYKNNPSRKRNSLQYRMGIHLIILNQKYNLHRLVTKYLITDRREIHTKLKNEKSDCCEAE